MSTKNYRKWGVLFLNYGDYLTSYALWYRAITEEPITDSLGNQSEDELRQLILDEECGYFVVMKETALYIQNQDFFEQYEWVYENDEGFVMKK